MKKTYSKPDIVFESFTLSSSIASCDVKTNLPSYKACGLPLPGVGNVFVDRNTGCQIKPNTLNPSNQSNEIFNGICYHVPYEDRNMFNS